MNWEGKTAIVTGASGGIGAAICKKLAPMKMNLVLSGRKRDMLERPWRHPDGALWGRNPSVATAPCIDRF